MFDDVIKMYVLWYKCTKKIVNTQSVIWYRKTNKQFISHLGGGGGDYNLDHRAAMKSGNISMHAPL
jgi:hypothetical protein